MIELTSWEAPTSYQGNNVTKYLCEQNTKALKVKNCINNKRNFFQFIIYTSNVTDPFCIMGKNHA